ncbi:hypothetical protein ACQP00_44890 [Dactylosporangium sp. CS-047395]|uniref:hypothetical protein n=1 Tax=Dactylosporangium sp. CS-047395 TaxID=3239936 RepID=UPI003D8D6430
MTYPPAGEPNQNQYLGGYPPPPPGPPPTGAFPAQPAAPGYPPQAQPQYPPTQGWQQAPPTQGWQQPPPVQPPTQGWQQPPPMQPPVQPPMQPYAPPRSSMPWVPIGVIAGILVLAVIGGVLVITKVFGGKDDEPTTPLAAPATTGGAAPTTGGLKTPSKTSAPAAGPAKYKAPGDVCGMDLSALGQYSFKKEKSTPNVRNTGGIARADCDFDLRTSAGVKVTFNIKTQVYSTAKEAKSYFDSGYDLDKQRYFDGELSGMGERAYGTNRDWDIGSKTSDYTIRLVDSNLYLSISLVTFGTAFVPKDQLKPKAVDEMKAILGKMPAA